MRALAEGAGIPEYDLPVVLEVVFRYRGVVHRVYVEAAPESGPGKINKKWAANRAIVHVLQKAGVRREAFPGIIYAVKNDGVTVKPTDKLVANHPNFIPYGEGGTVVKRNKPAVDETFVTNHNGQVKKFEASDVASVNKVGGQWVVTFADGEKIEIDEMVASVLLDYLKFGGEEREFPAWDGGEPEDF